jgi:hypothetical protein
VCESGSCRVHFITTEFWLISAQWDHTRSAKIPQRTISRCFLLIYHVPFIYNLLHSDALSLKCLRATQVTKRSSVVVFWIMAPCNLKGGYQCFGGTCCFHLLVNQTFQSSALQKEFWDLDGSVGIETRLRAVRPRNQNSIPRKRKLFLYSS